MGNGVPNPASRQSPLGPEFSRVTSTWALLRQSSACLLSLSSDHSLLPGGDRICLSSPLGTRHSSQHPSPPGHLALRGPSRCWAGYQGSAARKWPTPSPPSAPLASRSRSREGWGRRGPARGSAFAQFHDHARVQKRKRQEIPSSCQCHRDGLPPGPSWPPAPLPPPALARVRLARDKEEEDGKRMCSLARKAAPKPSRHHQLSSYWGIGGPAALTRAVSWLAAGSLWHQRTACLMALGLSG